MASFPISPIAGVTLPSTSTTKAALACIQAHNIPSTVNHCLRSAVFGVLIASKVPPLQHLDAESITLATMLHDLGWSEDEGFRSPDKRFEVDGANAALKFLKSSAAPDAKYSESTLGAIWYAIALHTTPSVSLHAEPLVAAVSMGIVADFLGPSTPGGVVSEDEFRAVLKALPRVGFAEDTTEILCGLCRTKPETTYDNFCGDLGRKLVEGYEEEWEKRRFDKSILVALKKNEVYET